jgi:hypothetical protein
MTAQINDCSVSDEIQMTVTNEVVTSVEIRQIGPSQDILKTLFFFLNISVDRKAE